jgi:predicted membrane metal-binding protein
MRNINLQRIGTGLFTAAMLIMAAIALLIFLDLPLAGLALLVIALIYLTIVFMPGGEQSNH